MRTTFLALALSLLLGAGAASAQERPAAGTAEVARRFYGAFVTGDIATLEALYAPNVRFRDPIFSFSDRRGTIGMWRVLLDPGAGGRFTYQLLTVDGPTARVKWIADYALLGRPIHNEITATLTIRDGQVVEHVDDFSWERWARQAFPLGPASSWRPVKSVLQRVMRHVLARQAAAKEREARAAAGIVDSIPK